MYGRIMNISAIVTFIINFTIVFILHDDYYKIFLFSYVLWDITLWGGMELFAKNKLLLGKK